MLPPTADTAASIQVQVPAAIYRPAPALKSEELGRMMERLFAQKVIELSYNRPESLIRSPSAIAAQRLATPSHFYPDEMLDWDVAIEVAPPRPTGTLSVTLEYGGRGTPTAVEDPWD
jgi:hypothetical protein